MGLVGKDLHSLLIVDPHLQYMRQLCFSISQDVLVSRSDDIMSFQQTPPPPLYSKPPNSKPLWVGPGGGAGFNVHTLWMTSFLKMCVIMMMRRTGMMMTGNVMMIMRNKDDNEDDDDDENGDDDDNG